GFARDRWSNGSQLFWTGAKQGDRLEVELDVEEAGLHDVEAVFTMARDYAVVQPYFDGEALGKPLDLYNFPDVVTSGVLTLGRRKAGRGTSSAAPNCLAPCAEIELSAGARSGSCLARRGQ